MYNTNIYFYQKIFHGFLRKVLLKGSSKNWIASEIPTRVSLEFSSDFPSRISHGCPQKSLRNFSRPAFRSSFKYSEISSRI